jgi:hypothetical protein
VIHLREGRAMASGDPQARRTKSWPAVKALAERLLGRPLLPCEHVRTVLKAPQPAASAKTQTEPDALAAWNDRLRREHEVLVAAAEANTLRLTGKPRF